MVVQPLYPKSRVTGRPMARILLAAPVLLTSCQQMREITGTENCDDPSLSHSQQKLCKDNASFHQTIAGGSILGGLGGAGTAALACAAAHTKTNPLACGAAGMVVGLFA